MKPTLWALLLALFVIPVTDTAAAKERPRKQSKETEVKRENAPAKRVTAAVKRERKQTSGPSDDNPSVGRKPVKIGPPVERQLTRAKGKVFDLRGLPLIPVQLEAG